MTAKEPTPIERGRKYAAKWYLVLTPATLANAYAQGFRDGMKHRPVKSRKPRTR